MQDFCFKIFNTMWTVSFVDSITMENAKEDEFTFGETVFEDNAIKIATKNGDGKQLSENTVKLTLLHEMIHAILCTGQYNDCGENEPLVEWLANCIYSLKEQGKL